MLSACSGGGAAGAQVAVLQCLFVPSTGSLHLGHSNRGKCTQAVAGLNAAVHEYGLGGEFGAFQCSLTGLVKNDVNCDADLEKLALSIHDTVRGGSCSFTTPTTTTTTPTTVTTPTTTPGGVAVVIAFDGASCSRIDEQAPDATRVFAANVAAACTASGGTCTAEGVQAVCAGEADADDASSVGVSAQVLYGAGMAGDAAVQAAIRAAIDSGDFGVTTPNTVYSWLPPLEYEAIGLFPFFMDHTVYLEGAAGLVDDPAFAAALQRAIDAALAASRRRSGLEATGLLVTPSLAIFQVFVTELSEFGEARRLLSQLEDTAVVHDGVTVRLSASPAAESPAPDGGLIAGVVVATLAVLGLTLGLVVLRAKRRQAVIEVQASNGMDRWLNGAGDEDYLDVREEPVRQSFLTAHYFPDAGGQAWAPFVGEQKYHVTLDHTDSAGPRWEDTPAVPYALGGGVGGRASMLAPVPGSTASDADASSAGTSGAAQIDRGGVLSDLESRLEGDVVRAEDALQLITRHFASMGLGAAQLRVISSESPGDSKQAPDQQGHMHENARGTRQNLGVQLGKVWHTPLRPVPSVCGLVDVGSVLEAIEVASGPADADGEYDNLSERPPRPVHVVVLTTVLTDVEALLRELNGVADSETQTERQAALDGSSPLRDQALRVLRRHSGDTVGAAAAAVSEAAASQLAAALPDSIDVHVISSVQLLGWVVVRTMRHGATAGGDIVPINRDAVIDAKAAVLTGDIPEWKDVLAAV